MGKRPGTRRLFLRTAAAGLAGLSLSGSVLRGARAAARRLPTTDPAARLRLGWTGKLRWDHVVDVTEMPGESWLERFEAAQDAVTGSGGGVVYFRPGTYRFDDSLRIRPGVIVRGSPPGSTRDGREAAYVLTTRFEFPRYVPVLHGDGAPTGGAFRGIYLDSPATASDCGIVEILVNRGHIHFDEDEAHRVGSNRIVWGCILQNAAVADPSVPDLELGQHAWQRYTRWHFSAIDVKSRENALVANNRLIASTDSFTMPGYRLQGRGKKGLVTHDVVFDYDNRPGIEVNHYCAGAPGGEEPSGTPESHPWGFRKGAVIRDNFIYSTGRTAIAFNGDGTLCAGNVIRFRKDVWRQTNQGTKETSGSSTNDNRAVEMRGYRWIVEDNDYEVHRNWAADHKYHINDGEGLMHENHCNSAIIESRLSGNRGNTYLSLYKTGRIEGLVIERNDIRVAPSVKKGVDQSVAIFVEADHSPDRRGPCRDVSIVDNTTRGGILIAGSPSSGNRVAGNRSVDGRGLIKKRAEATLEGNTGYRVVEG